MRALAKPVESDSNQKSEMLTIGSVVERLRREYPEVSHSSLRFLEREGLVTSSRTKGGHRLYHPSVLERIRQIKAWQAQHLSLEEIRRRLEQLDALPERQRISDEFLRLALAGDLPAARALIVMISETGMPLAEVFGEVLRPAMTELGRLWAAGEVRVSQEKEVSELTRDLVAELSVQRSHPNPQGPTVVAACVRGELHCIGLRMVCGLLGAAGYLVHYLGADVAPEFLADAVGMRQPEIVLLSAKIEENLPAVEPAIAAVLEQKHPQGRPAVFVGGQLAIDHFREITAWGATPIASETPDEVFTLLSRMIPPANQAA
jgi:methanogenic corrinoid protein MtbC1